MTVSDNNKFALSSHINLQYVLYYLGINSAGQINPAAL